MSDEQVIERIFLPPVEFAKALRPGDRVLLGLRAPVTAEAARTLRARLHQTFPDVQFVVVADCTALVFGTDE